MEKGDYLELPILRIEDTEDASYYVVRSDDGAEHRVKMYIYQRNNEEERKRVTLPCLVRADRETGHLFLVQNSAQVLRNHYEDGQIYTLTITRSINCDDMRFLRYQAQDELLVPVIVQAFSSYPLRPQQTIDARAVYRSENFLVFHYQPSKSEEIKSKARLRDLLRFTQLTSSEIKWVKRQFHRLSHWKKARQQKIWCSPSWPILALVDCPSADAWPICCDAQQQCFGAAAQGLEHSNETTPSQVNKKKARGVIKPEHAIRLLQAYRDIALHVVEDAEWLEAFSENERERNRERISKRIATANHQIEALQLIAQRKDESTVTDVLHKLNVTGYVYDLKHRLRILSALFSLNKDLLERHIDTLLNFIARNGQGWKTRGLPMAFSSFLEGYISESLGQSHHLMGRPNTAEDRQLVERVVQALCYVLALSHPDHPERAHWQTMLYYHLALVAPQRLLSDEKSTRHMAERLLDRAFWCLVQQEVFPASLVWQRDFHQLDLLGYHLLDASPAVASLIPHTFETELVSLSLTREGLRLQPTKHSSSAREVLPQNFVDWHGLQIVIDGTPRLSSKATLTECVEWWSLVERTLFTPPSLSAPATKKEALELLESQRNSGIQAQAAALAATQGKETSVNGGHTTAFAADHLANHGGTETIVPGMKRKTLAEKGTRVKVRVLRQDPLNWLRFYCRIEDEHYRGEGWLETYVKGRNEGLFSFNPNFRTDSFFYEGKPLLFEVEVKGFANESGYDELLHFDAQPIIMPKILGWVNDIINDAPDNQSLCLITGTAGQMMRGITEEGYMVLVDGTRDCCCQKDDFVLVRYTKAYNVSSIYTEAIEIEPDRTFDLKEVAEELLYDYANGETYDTQNGVVAEEDEKASQIDDSGEGDNAALVYSTEHGSHEGNTVFTDEADLLKAAVDEEGSSTIVAQQSSSAVAPVIKASAEELEEASKLDSEEVMWTDADVRLLLQILDQQASLQSDRPKAYALLSVAHIIAHMSKSFASLERYFETRRQLLRQLDHYAVNRQIDREAVENIGQQSQWLINRYPSLRQQFTEILLVGSMDDVSKNEFLWKTTQEFGSNHRLGKLARLILSFNLSTDFAMEHQNDDLRNQIQHILGIEVELPKTFSFGNESQTLEFKTTTVFPPDNDMLPNVDRQTNNLMRVICGMLNAQGGTLLLGVNDAGVPCGLDEDVRFFKKDLDAVKRHVRHAIFREFGVGINNRVTEEEITCGRHTVVAFHIPASEEPVALRGNYYVRQGTSTYYEKSAAKMREMMANRIFDAETETENQCLVSAEAPGCPAHLEAEAGESVQEVAADGAPSANDEAVSAEQQHEEKVSTDGVSHASSVAANEDSEEQWLTSHIRSNVVNSWEEGYGVDTVGYLRFFDNGEWCFMEEENWQPGRLTLAVHEREMNGSLIMVYEDGVVNSVPLDYCLDKTPDKHYKRYDDCEPIFVCPAAPGDALLTAYEHENGERYYRLDNVSDLPEGKMLSSGKPIVTVDFAKIVLCEVIPASALEGLEKIRRQKPTTLGYSLEHHAERERAILENLGVHLL